MPLHSYGVLKGKAIEVRLGAGQSPHYQVRIVDDTTDYRIAVNVKSQLAPSEVEYIVVERFQHPITATRRAAAARLHAARERSPASGALDFIRGNLFDRTQMRPLPFSVPGFDNDLNEKLDRVMQRAVADENALVYAFGERWGPEPGVKDKYFGFLPGQRHPRHPHEPGQRRPVRRRRRRVPGRRPAGPLSRTSSEWVGDVPEVPVAGLAHRRRDRPRDRPEPPSRRRRSAAADRSRRPPTSRTAWCASSRRSSTRRSRRRSRSSRCSTPRRTTSTSTGWALLDTQKKRLPLSGALARRRDARVRSPAAAGAVEQGRRHHAASTTRA